LVGDFIMTIISVVKVIKTLYTNKDLNSMLSPEM